MAPLQFETTGCRVGFIVVLTLLRMVIPLYEAFGTAEVLWWVLSLWHAFVMVQAWRSRAVYLVHTLACWIGWWCFLFQHDSLGLDLALLGGWALVGFEWLGTLMEEEDHLEEADVTEIEEDETRYEDYMLKIV